MRWKTKVPEVGKRRTIKKFAFFPKGLDDGYSVLFEHYLVEQQLIKVAKHKNKYKWITLKTRVK